MGRRFSRSELEIHASGRISELFGPTFAGLDFLVVMAAFLAGWFFSMDRPRWSRLAWAIASVGVAHLLYLCVLSHSVDLLQWLPERQEPAHQLCALLRRPHVGLGELLEIGAVGRRLGQRFGRAQNHSEQVV
jgi:hypothetical protein